MAEMIRGLSIELGLDSAKIDSGLTNLKSKLSAVNSEMRANLSAFDKSDKSVKHYETRLDGINKKLEVQKAVTEQAKKHHEKMVAEFGEGSTEADNAAKKYNEQATALNNLSRYAERTSDDLKRLKEEQRIASSEWTKFGDQLENTGTKLTKIGDSMKDIGAKMSMYVTAPIVGFGAVAAKTGIDFDDTMAKVQAISGATGDDLDNLREKAKEMGATTKFSASESAEALTYMAMAGWKTEDMLGGIEGVMSLAAASGEDLASVSDILTDALTAFGMGADQSGELADILAAASSNANTNVSMLGESFKYVAPVAGAMGYSAEDVSVALGLMANSGIKASNAGTALRSMMTNMAAPTKAMKNGMEDLGLSLTDNDGNMKSYATIMDELREKMGGLTEAEQAAYAAQIFGKEAMSGALAIVNASPEDYEKLTESINNSSGAAEEMATIMEGTLGGKIREIKSGLEGFSISIYETMQPALEGAADKVGDFVGWLNNLSPKMKMTGVIFAALAAAIGPMLVVMGTLISMFGGVMTALAPVMKSIGKAGGLIKWLRLGFIAFTGPVGIAIGILTALGIGFVALYAKSETFRDGVSNVLSSLKDLGKDLLSSIRPAIDAVVQFFKDQFKVLQDFWSDNSATIIGAATNIGSVVSSVFKGIWSVIQFVMPLVLAIIQSIWKNIQGVISGALDIIMGLVKVFSGLFTGDFSKMWEGLKQMFFGAVRFIWNIVQLTFFGKLLGGAKAFIFSFRGFFSSMWGWIKNLFLNSVKSTVGFLVNGWTRANAMTMSIFRGIFNFLKSIWSNIWGTVRYTVGLMRSGISNAFSAIRTGIVNLTTRARDGVVNGWTRLRDGVVNLATRMKDKVSDIFTKMVDAAKALPGKMKDGIVNAKNKAVDGIKNLGNSMVKQFGKVVNGLIGGVNNITGKLGIKAKISEWEVPEFHGGTDGHKGGPMIVGDRYGRELVQFPNGNTWLSPDSDTLVPNAPKGTKVIPNRITEKILSGNIPMYSKGTGFKKALSGAADWTKDAFHSAKAKTADWAVNVWDYASNPSKLFTKMIDALGLSISGLSGFAKDAAKGGFKLVKDKALDYVKGMFGKAEEGGEGSKAPMSFGNLRMTSGFGYRTHPITGQAHLHGGIDFAGPIGTAIKAQVGGMVTSSGYNYGGYGNLVTIRNGIYDYYYAHLDKAMAKVGAMVKRGDIIGTLGNTGQSTGPHLHYEIRKNGQRINPGISGFANGGLIKREQLAWVGEGNKEEVIIPTGDKSKRSTAMKLLALAAKRIGAGGGSGGSTPSNKIPNVSMGSDNRVVELLQQLLLIMQQGSGMPETLVIQNNLDGELIGEQIVNMAEYGLGRNNQKKSFNRGMR